MCVIKKIAKQSIKSGENGSNRGRLIALSAKSRPPDNRPQVVPVIPRTLQRAAVGVT